MMSYTVRKSRKWQDREGPGRTRLGKKMSRISRIGKDEQDREKREGQGRSSIQTGQDESERVGFVGQDGMSRTGKDKYDRERKVGQSMTKKDKVVQSRRRQDKVGKFRTKGHIRQVRMSSIEQDEQDK